MTCPICGTVPVPGARFCHVCGSALATAGAPPTSPLAAATERRVVTVLFGDLSDFTAWSEDLDPERVGTVTDRVLAALAQAVRTFGGTVDKLTGDGIMAVFGAPVTHEDDAERAVRAALAMQRAVRRLVEDADGGGRRLGLRVGLNTGEVVAGVQAALSYTVVGDTVNTAARLSDAAGIGGVYAGAETARATRDRAAWRRLTPLRLKGKREPVEAYELLRLRDAPGARPGLGDEAPFVGREVELGRLLGRFAETVDRRGPHVVLITAEAGVGKTRLSSELSRQLGGQPGTRVLRVRCAQFGDGRALGPLVDLVRQAAGIDPDYAHDTAADGGPGDVAARVRRLADRVVPGAGSGAPAVADVLVSLAVGSPVPTSRHDELPGLDGSTEPGSLRELAPAAVVALLGGLAAEGPLLLVVDDLHVAAPEAIDGLAEVVGALAGPVLAVLLGRSELVRSALPARVPDVELLPLPPLSGAASVRLLRAYLSGGSLPQADETRLLATAQGNPYYLAELVQLLLDQGRLTGGPSGWRLAGGGLSGRLLSSDLAAVLTARIDALPVPARLVLRDAAVVGDRVPVGALRALTGTGRGADAGGELDRAVAELAGRRMLHRGNRDDLAFPTSLLREAVYAGVGKADLADRHAEVARWAQARRPGRDLTETERDELIAVSAERATTLADAMRLPAAADSRSVAGIGAEALGRLAEAVLCAGEARRAGELLTRAEALAGPTPPASLLLLCARVLVQTAAYGEALRTAERAAEQAAGAESGVRHADRTRTGEPQVRAGALIVAGEAHRALGDPDAAAGCWARAVTYARAEHLGRYEADALRRLGMLDYLTGRLRQAERRFATAYALATRAGDGPGQGWALQHQAWAATSRGDFAAAEEALERAGRLFAERGDTAGRSWVSGTGGFVRLLQGRLTEARSLARDFLPFGERAGDTWGVAALRTVEAFAAAELGELTHADAGARQALLGFAEVDDPWGRSLALVVRGVVARGLGEPELAVPLLVEAVSVAEGAAHPLTIGMARTVLGYCRLDAGEPEAAEAAARATLDLIAPLDLDEAARVGPVVLLAQACRRQGDLGTALRLLGEAATAAGTPSLVFPRRQALAHLAGALLEAGHRAEALRAAERAQQVPAEDVRSRVVALRALAGARAATGDGAGARAAVDEASALAHATEQTSERSVTDALRHRIGAGVGSVRS